MEQDNGKFDELEMKISLFDNMINDTIAMLKNELAELLNNNNYVQKYSKRNETDNAKEKG